MRSNHVVLWVTVLTCLLCGHALVQGQEVPSQVDVFVSGTEGYHTFRIPALLVTPDGTLLAICEGRKTSGADHGDVDLVLKRSPMVGGPGDRWNTSTRREGTGKSRSEIPVRWWTSKPV